jgi:hypothetical protein
MLVISATIELGSAKDFEVISASLRPNRSNGRNLVIREVGGFLSGELLKAPIRKLKTHAVNIRASKHLKNSFATWR